MKLSIQGYASAYQPEHVARLFFPLAELWGAPVPRGEDAVIVRLGKYHMACAVRLGGVCSAVRAPLPSAAQGDVRLAHAAQLFRLLAKATGITPPWGMLTGVRPVSLVHDLRAKGLPEQEVHRYFCNDFFVSEDKYRLAARTAQVQQPILAQNTPKSYSLYIGIPFCPSRCSYCSFVSRTASQSAKLIAPYVTALCAELAEIAALAKQLSLKLETIYIGGGTPTALSAPQLETVLRTVREQFDIGAVKEYTVEAGRPDCTDYEKLVLIKQYGATRISINPQSLSNSVLAAIGRKHTAQDIIDCFWQARKAGHTNINMDVIAGLPTDTQESFVKTLEGVLALSPENITVHTLTLKRASSLVTSGAAAQYGDVARMVQASQQMLAGYEPYYLYRQKGTLQNLENVGYTKPGFAGLYNVYIMEEVHTILSAGCGGSTKLVGRSGEKIERIFNFKYPTEYLARFAELHEKKEGVKQFYGKFADLDSETSCGSGPHQCGGAPARTAGSIL